MTPIQRQSFSWIELRALTSVQPQAMHLSVDGNIYAKIARKLVRKPLGGVITVAVTVTVTFKAKMSTEH